MADVSFPKMEISVVNVHGRSAELTIDKTWTVDRLKKEYAEHYGTTWYGWYMMYMGKCLQGGELLSDHGIKNGSIIHVQCRLGNHISQPVELYVTDLGDHKTVLVIADAEWSIQRIKKEYSQLKGPEWINCKLYYRGSSLRERRALAEYQIRDEAVLHSAIASVPSTQAGLRSLKKCILRKRTCKFL